MDAHKARLQEYYAYLNAKAYGEYPLSFESWLLAALDSAERERDALRAALDSESLREQLAAIEHERWSGWMHYMFNRTAFNDDGTWTMPAWAVERWTRQMNTPYAELTEKEKGSDRAEVDKTLTAIRSVLYPPPHPPAPPSADWRADCLAWLQGDGHRYVAFQTIMMLDNLNVAGAAWDDAAENIVVIIFTDTITDAEIEGAKRAVDAYKRIRDMESAYALIVVPAGHGRAVADDAIAVAEWTGERVTRV